MSTSTSTDQSKLAPAADASHTPSPAKGLGDKWAQQMREKYEEGAEDRNKLVEDRVEKAQDWIRREINKLKAWIKKLGKPDEKGCLVVEYGVLFKEQNNMEALSGTLKTARRLGVVSYDVEHLMQGRDDHVKITLLHDDDKRYDIVISDKGSHAGDEPADPFELDAKTHEVVPCHRCKQPVQPADRVGVAGKVLHRKCFECHLDECTIQLTPSRYASIEVDGVLRFYCVAHFHQLFAVGADYEKGFRQGKGGEIHDDSSSAASTPAPEMKKKEVHAPKKEEAAAAAAAAAATEKKPEAPHHSEAASPASSSPAAAPKVKHYEVKAAGGLASPNVHKH